MKVLLLSLLLVSVLLAPALAKDSPGLKRFKDDHTYNKRNRNFDCSTVMNRAALNGPTGLCKPCSHVILGDRTDITPIDDVINICRGEGTRVIHPEKNDLYQSNRVFRTVKCRLQNRNVLPPNCIYTGEIQTGRITVGCYSQEPVHFEGCEQ